MEFSFKYLSICLICGIFLLAMPADAQSSPHPEDQLAATKVAIVTTAKGAFSVTRPDGSVVQGTIGMALRLGDLIQTGRGASIMVMFLDQTRLALAGSADLKIKDYLYQDGQEPRSVVTVKNGAFQFMAGKIGELAPQNYKIETETATIGIRGSGGSVVTSDGTQGVPAGLVARTVAGHVLEVTTFTGEMVVVEDPDRGVRVDADGRASRFQVNADPFEQALALQEHGLALALAEQEPSPQPLQQEDHTHLVLYFRRRQSLRFERKRAKSLRNRVSMSSEKPRKFEDIAASVYSDWASTHDTIRDVSIESEKGSARPILEKTDAAGQAEAHKKEAPLPVRSEQQADLKERGSMTETLKDLSKQQLSQQEQKELADER